MDVHELCSAIDESITKVVELQAENAALTRRVEVLEGLLWQAIAATEAANSTVVMQSVRSGLPYEGPVFNVTEAKAALEDK